MKIFFQQTVGIEFELSEQEYRAIEKEIRRRRNYWLSGSLKLAQYFIRTYIQIALATLLTLTLLFLFLEEPSKLTLLNLAELLRNMSKIIPTLFIGKVLMDWVMGKLYFFRPYLNTEVLRILKCRYHGYHTQIQLSPLSQEPEFTCFHKETDAPETLPPQQ